ncbi:hypothetical protein PFISCL1PPCAC_28817, partial [Pristionchus fissidentatus]
SGQMKSNSSQIDTSPSDPSYYLVKIQHMACQHGSVPRTRSIRRYSDARHRCPRARLRVSEARDIVLCGPEHAHLPVSDRWYSNPLEGKALSEVDCNPDTLSWAVPSILTYLCLVAGIITHWKAPEDPVRPHRATGRPTAV